MKKSLIFAVVVFITLTSVFLWWENGKKAVDQNDKIEKIFIIEKGLSIREIANKLAREHFINDPIVFFLYVKQTGQDKRIQAGDYRLSASMNLETIVSKLTHGTLDIWVTFPEGLRAEEVADILKANFKTYNESWKDSLILQNGYIFPDTYLFQKDASIDLILKTTRNNFEKKFEIFNQSKSDRKIEDIVTIASLIEREARYGEDRPLVASVIYNRLNNGMPLQIDATVQYALGYQKDTNSWWKQNLASKDIELESLFNTYKHIGLPPSPISNPGLEALNAAILPPKSDYLYYVSDKTGHLHFTRNLEEHNKNIKKYISQ